jgi:hypothetical protein
MDSLNSVLVECVKACGGSKQIGPLLWPEKTPDAAQRLILDCLNDDRPAHLMPDQVLFVLKIARDKGVHLGFEFMAERLGYTKPIPTEPRDEMAELQRQFIEAQKAMSAMVEKMNHVTASMNTQKVRLAA